LLWVLLLLCFLCLLLLLLFLLLLLLYIIAIIIITIIISIIIISIIIIVIVIIEKLSLIIIIMIVIMCIYTVYSLHIMHAANVILNTPKKGQWSHPRLNQGSRLGSVVFPLLEGLIAEICHSSGKFKQANCHLYLQWMVSASDWEEFQESLVDYNIPLSPGCTTPLSCIRPLTNGGLAWARTFHWTVPTVSANDQRKRARGLWQGSSSTANIPKRGLPRPAKKIQDFGKKLGSKMFHGRN
jgi:hypothetical protein